MPESYLKSCFCFYGTLLLFAAIVGSSAVVADENEPEDFSFEQPKVTIEIEDPHKQAAIFYRVVGERIEVVKKLEPQQSRYLFRVPPGKYVVGDASGALYPIPAGFGNDTIKLTIPKCSPEKEHLWAWIPAGPSLIGDELGVGAEDERPVRIETTSAFWLAKHEVTNEQYTKFLLDQPKLDPRWIDLESRMCRIKQTPQLEETKFTKADQHRTASPKLYTTDAPELPVVMISYAGAIAYCQWLTQKTGQTHRLPTEIEWEKAARGPRSNIFSYGNTYRQTGANQESGTIKNVGRYGANWFGLRDMTGNVFEWTANKYDTKRLPPGASKNTHDMMNQTLRGGSFVLDGMYLRNSFRMRQSPTVMTDDIGFRVLRKPATKEQK